MLWGVGAVLAYSYVGSMVGSPERAALAWWWVMSTVPAVHIVPSLHADEAAREGQTWADLFTHVVEPFTVAHATVS